jgi:hypothetical protein
MDNERSTQTPNEPSNLIMANSRTRIIWATVLVLFVVVWVARNSLRHYAAHHASTIGITRDPLTTRNVVTSLRSDTGLIILAQIICSDAYLRDEYRRTKDISVFATQQSIYRGSLSTKDCEVEMSKGAVGFVDK